MNLVVVPFHDWNKCEREGFRTRDAHFMEEFGKHPSVDKMLVVNRPLSPVEMAKNKVFRANGTVRQVSEKIYTVDSVIYELWQPVLQRRNWIPHAYGHTRTLQSLQRSLAKLGIAEYVLWSNSPIHVPFVMNLHPQIYTFDMTDNLYRHADYRNLPNLDSFYLYSQQNAQVITTNSPENRQWLAEKRSDAVYISNGVSPERFNTDIRREIPADLKTLPRPIVGYAGKMQEMVDRELVEKMVCNLSEVSFVFIGQVLNEEWMRPLWRFPNVHYLGDKHYEQLPDYLAAFDVCSIPYDVTRQHGGDPIKFYEYLAMKKPIVTTSIGGVSRFSDWLNVCVADSSTDFIDGLKFFVQQLQQGRPIAAENIPNDITWAYKADQVIQMMLAKRVHAQSH